MDIVFEDVSHVFDPDVRALDGVDLTIPSGQSVAVVGATGSGKSTLLRHLDGLLRPASGRMLVGGMDAASLSVAQLASRVGLAFQEPDRQIFGRTVGSEVRFGPRHLGRDGRQQDDAVAAALAATGLSGTAERHPYDLGPAGRKLVSIASVLAMETPIVAFDEPAAGLDANGVARVGAIIEQLHAAGRTVIGVSHRMSFVAEHFERIIVLHEGRVILDGDPTTVFAQEVWPLLAVAGLEPPAAARLGVSLGLGSTPTEASLVAALERSPPRP